MGLVVNFKASNLLPNQIGLNWQAPLDFNNSTDEIIVTKTSTHFPMELYNSSFPNRATDNRPIEIFRSKSIPGLNTGTISVLGSVLTDTGASFSTSPNLKGLLLRDINSSVYRIISNTTTTLTLSGNPANGKYVVLPDFSEVKFSQESYEVDTRTEVGIGFIKNLVTIQNNSFLIRLFEQDELANYIFNDGAGNKFIVKSNTQDTVYFYETTTPTIGIGMAILNSHFNSTSLPYLDMFKNTNEADTRIGSGLDNDKFYYYTVFTKPSNTNVAQAEFSTYQSNISTQAFALSTQDKQFGTVLYNLWPSIYRELDATEDLQDLMSVFGSQLNELHSTIKTYNLQDTENVLVTAALPLSEQFGLPSVGYSLGADTLRRIARNILQCWKLKGTKEGIALFIRTLTTWDITNGTGDFTGSVQDFLPNVTALRLFDPNLGNLNTRLTNTDPFIGGGRFVKSLPGVVIPGFFTFREFVITLPNVALYVGNSQSVVISGGNTIITDTNNNFGATDSLVGNFLLPNTEEVNDIYQIINNTSTSITLRGVINNKVSGGNYAVLSPLNASRFIILNKLMPVYIPHGTKQGFLFTIS